LIFFRRFELVPRLGKLVARRTFVARAGVSSAWLETAVRTPVVAAARQAFATSSSGTLSAAETAPAVRTASKLARIIGNNRGIATSPGFCLPKANAGRLFQFPSVPHMTMTK